MGKSEGGDIIAGTKGRRVQRRPANQGGWTVARRKKFLDVLASSSNVKLAAEAVGAPPSAPYIVRQRDPVFAAMWQEALAIGYDRLEHALLERARLGVNDIEIDGEVPLLVGSLDKPDASRGARMAGGRVEIDVKLAQWLIDRHDKSVRGLAGSSTRRAPPRAAIEAKIVAKLEALKKQGRFDQ